MAFGPATRAYRVTTDSRHRLPVAPNVPNLHFTPSEPNHVFTSDITSICTAAQPGASGW